MTVFLAALDETQSDAGDFTMGGWIAPQDDWEKSFEPARRQRVLKGQSRPIPHLHMRTIWNEGWQDKHGITGSDAYWCVEEAASVIYSTGSLYPFTSGMSAKDFNRCFVDELKEVGGFGEILYSPDYLCFIVLTLVAMKYVQLKFPDATRVDILVEESERTTTHMKGFHEHMDKFLDMYPELMPLKGQLRIGNKTSIPAQAADMLIWHVQRLEAGRLKSKAERRRYWMMTSRPGFPHEHTQDYLLELAAKLREEMTRRRREGTATD